MFRLIVSLGVSQVMGIVRLLILLVQSFHYCLRIKSGSLWVCRLWLMKTNTQILM